MRLTKIIADIEGFTGIIQKKILHIDDSYNIILCIFIYRKTGKAIFAENIDQFLISGIYVCKRNIDSWNHDILCISISQIKYVVDHFLFIGFNDPIFVTDIYDRTELFLCHSRICCIRIYMK